MRCLGWLLLLLWPGFAWGAELVYHGEQTLLSDTVWDGTVLVDGILTVPVGVTLEIRPGSVVRFTRNDSNGDQIGEHEIFVQGTFLALGNAAAPILFTSAEAQPQAGDWGAINMMASEQDNRLDHCIVEYAYRGFHAHFARGHLSDSEFRYNTRGAQFQESTVTIERCRFVDNLNGLQFRDSTVELHDTRIAGNYWGLRCVYSLLTMSGCRIERNRINGANLRDSTLFAEHNCLTGNRKGLYLQRSKGRIRSNLIADNSEHGTLLEDSACDFIGNRLTGNGRAGLRIVNSGVTLANNDFSGNGEYALINDGTTEVFAVGNWWGTTDPVRLETLVRDGADRPGLGRVTLSPALPAAPSIRMEVK
ncbi:hypothetical protein JCM30471_09250 [Desulfuromonas carbonis]|uniref:right-handed parallel beta-helix repeat-containing protein n=1 Tax=Desulfuromonas sp. DDH964 TaxID=1823759 RepID=UPI00078B1CC6|nr:right-handed parallel beta-helix repeat-containing protein [Desulfuromonas sp. DDH964]AMV72408.1 hypothetical protein DBW_2065 [Desulfuromonas sp. DDH964]